MNQLLKLLLLTSIMGVFQTPAFAASSVNVSLWDDGGRMGINISSDKTSQGKVTFNVKNTSKFQEHEMLVAKVNNFHDAIPYDTKAARIIEDKIQDLGEVSELKPGTTGSLTLNLTPGKYLLFCNVAGHFEMGMFTQLIVTP